MTEFPAILIEPGLGLWRRSRLDEDGFPASLDHLSDAALDATGAIFDACVTKVDPTLDLAFLDLGDGRSGVMNQRRARLRKKGRSFAITDSVSEGERLKVQAVSDPQSMDGKAIAVTPRPKLTGRYCVVETGGQRLNFSKDLGPARIKALTPLLEGPASRSAIIIRGRAQLVDPDVVAAEANQLTDALTRPVGEPGLVFAFTPLMQALKDLPDTPDPVCIEGGSALADAKGCARTAYPDLVDRLVQLNTDAPAFDAFGIDEAIEEALSGRIDLPSGGWITISPTPAFTAVDVNMGSAYRAQDAAEAKLGVNMEAAMAIAHQMRFQNIGGLIVIDFIDMTGKGRIETLLKTLTHAVQDDPQPVQLSGLSQFGLVQINRARRGLSLLERMTAQPPRRLRASTIAEDLLRRALRLGHSKNQGDLVITAPDAVREVFDEVSENLTKLEGKTGRRIIIEDGAPSVRIGANHG